MATAKPFGNSLYFLAIAHSYGKVGTKPMLAAAYDYNPIVSASGLLFAFFSTESCENARFLGFSGNFCPTFTDIVCIKDSVGIDFACGTGGFLIDAVEHLRKQVTRAKGYAIIERTVMGVEKKQLPYMLCTTNMLLHDVNYPQITHGNSLQKNVRDYTETEKVDFILMNPPYGGHEQDGIQVNFPSKLRSSETANLFMVEILYRLREDGRCGVILPDGFLQNDDASLIRIKEKLFSECNVHTIIRMPGSCFAPYTSIATNLLFFDKTGSTTETWFYRFDLPNGQKFSMKRNLITREKLAAIDEWWDNRTEIKDEKTDESLSDTWKSQCVSIDTIVGGNYNIDFCGFPNEEKVILSPEDTISTFKEERDRLDRKLDEKLHEILELLGVGE
ncbi:MAG: SAM-dependent methyltransferase [Lachnospiraceae bacterium]|nr:SAM-dependent methyltransferase [Lachnospiraceae bacterium]